MVDARWILTNYMPYYDNLREVNGVYQEVCRACFKPISETRGRKERKFCNDKCKSDYWTRWGWSHRCYKVFQRDDCKCRDCGKPLGTWGSHSDFDIHHIITVEWMPYVVGAALRHSCENLIKPLRDLFETHRDDLYPYAKIWWSEALKLNPPPSHSEILENIILKAALNHINEKARYILALRDALLETTNLITLCQKCHDKPHVHNLPDIPTRPFHDYRFDPHLGLEGLRQPREIALEESIWGGLIRDFLEQGYRYKRDHETRKIISETWYNNMKPPREGKWIQFAEKTFKIEKYRQKAFESFLTPNVCN